MATIKSFTDVSQSKALAEILPLESADMRYAPFGDTHPWVWDEEVKLLEKGSIPCWSLAGLYGIFPNNKKESTTLSRGGWKIEPPEYIDNWWCEYEDDNHTKDFAVSADNPVDACVAMVEKLNELKML